MSSPKFSVNYGSHQIIGSSNEDRGCSEIKRPDGDYSLFACFGVFDGHYGSMAAAASAQHLHKAVFKRFTALSSHSSVTEVSDSLTLQDKLDACFCEAMKMSCQEMDENIRSSDKSGSCMESIVCMALPDGATRIYSSSIGDSRTVLFGSKFSAIYERTSMDESGHSSLGNSEHDNEMGVSEHDGREPLPKLARKKANKLTRAYALTEDHVLTLPREKLRIQNEEDRMSLETHWVPLPAEVICDIVAFDPKYNANYVCKLPKGPTAMIPSLFDIGYPSSDRMRAASQLVKDIASTPAVASDIALVQTKYTSNGSKEDDENFTGFAIQHQTSFIDKRDPKFDKEFLFGRYNLSAMMTRTIGDKYGPRSCIPLPDISSITIRAGEFGRIVMASDGMWDVLTVESVRKAVMKFKDPEDCAVALAQSASNLRISHGIRKDDITVLVIDIHPEVYDAVYTVNKCVIA